MSGICVSPPLMMFHEEVCFADKLKTEHFIEGEIVEHHGLLPQQIELSFGSF